MRFCHAQAAATQLCRDILVLCFMRVCFLAPQEASEHVPSMRAAQMWPFRLDLALLDMVKSSVDCDQRNAGNGHEPPDLAVQKISHGHRLEAPATLLGAV